MNSFQLYENIEREISDKSLDNEDLSEIEKENLIDNISKINQNGCELIYVLIRVDKNKEINKNVLEKGGIPYGGKKLKKKIKFNLENLPIKLKQIINRFVSMHLESTKEKIIF